jgi:hypothetical protein
LRYLTKLASRIVALISRDHLDAILWKDGEEEEEFDSDNDDDSREYNFEVFKSEEQEEAVLVKSGFVVRSVYLLFQYKTEADSVDASSNHWHQQ